MSVFLNASDVRSCMKLLSPRKVPATGTISVGFSRQFSSKALRRELQSLFRICRRSRNGNWHYRVTKTPPQKQLNLKALRSGQCK